jgi:hypothetical protein
MLDGPFGQKIPKALARVVKPFTDLQDRAQENG